MHKAEKNRLRTAYLEMKGSIQTVVACLEAEVERLDEEIRNFMKEHEEFGEQEKLLRSAKSVGDNDDSHLAGRPAGVGKVGPQADRGAGGCGTDESG